MISRSYLQEWANKKGLVEVADLTKGIALTTAIGNATVVSYAYRTENLSTNLEAQFGKIEGAGIFALRQLRKTHKLTKYQLKNAIAFLDMYRERGLYADQAGIRTPATLLMQDGSLQQSDLSLGDRMVLASHVSNSIRIDQMGIEEWPWSIRKIDNALTGDGALALWRQPGSAGATTITFPLSPNEILVIGRDLDCAVDINAITAMKSRRWLIAQCGGINKKWVPIYAVNHHPGPPRWISLKKRDLSLNLEVC
jgi:hypothetical protein